jgi:hypothetical protein
MSELLLGGSPTVTGQAYRIEDAVGTDDGTNIQSWFETHWFEVSSGHQSRLRQLRMLFRGTNLTITTSTDFATSGGTSSSATSTLGGTNWDGSTWGSGMWNASYAEVYGDVFHRPVGRAFKVRIDETSDLTFTQPALLESGAALTRGGWAIYSIDGQFTPLGLT